MRAGRRRARRRRPARRRHILAIDRSAKAVAQATAAAAYEIASGRMSVRQAAVEEFALDVGEAPFDLAFAVRVGAREITL